MAPGSGVPRKSHDTLPTATSRALEYCVKPVPAMVSTSAPVQPVATGPAWPAQPLTDVTTSAALDGRERLNTTHNNSERRQLRR